MLFAIGCTVEVSKKLRGASILFSTIFSVTSVFTISIVCSTTGVVIVVSVFPLVLTVATEVVVVPFCWF